MCFNGIFKTTLRPDGYVQNVANLKILLEIDHLKRLHLWDSFNKESTCSVIIKIVLIKNICK